VLRSELTLRLITAAVAVPLLVGVILAGSELTAAVLALALSVAYLEFMSAGNVRLRDPLVWVGVAGIGALAGAAASPDIPLAWPLTAAVIALLATPVMEELVRRERRDLLDAAPSVAEVWRATGLAIVGLVYIGWLGAFAVLLRKLPAGDEWLLLALFSVILTDTGAFGTGKLFGRHQLAPRISPNKTVEGALGGWAVGFSAVILLRFLPDIEIDYWRIVLLAVVLPLFAQIGDLVASMIKRAMDVKDFSQLLPGHGGVLDRFDSLLFGIPTVYLFVRWLSL
jgi:phosphatidate cytidylyltransferase